MYRLIVHGEPASQGSKARGRYGGVYEQMGPKVRAWREAVEVAVLVTGRPSIPLGTGGLPLRVDLVFHVKRPKSHYRSGRFAHILRDDAPDYVAQDPDVDKLIRATFDALTISKVIADDNLIVQGNYGMVWANGKSGADIMVASMSPRRSDRYPPI